MVSVAAPAEAHRLTYRGDIDGLRALAVLAVIGFHAAPRWIPGGFAGVDVFFVISGFLISGLIFDELRDRDSFDAFEFYARRIRRIFPALIVVLLASWVIGWFVLVQSEFSELQKHIAAASVFVPNFTLWQDSGYFDRPSDLKPLLHLWSLGIEEQFYLFWPPLLYVCWKRGLNVLSIALLIVAGSFALNVILIRSYGAATFYLPHSRIWELLVGAVLAYLHAFHRQRVDAALDRFLFVSPADADAGLVRNALAWTGLALVAAAVLGLQRSTDFPGLWRVFAPLRAIATGLGLDAAPPYPGWWAAIPTIGTALLIWAGAQAFPNRTMLSLRPVVFVGLISYPLYLWHWPLLAFVRITESGNPSPRLRLWAIAVSFIAASLTYLAIERPIRRSVSVRTPSRVIAIAALLLVVGAGSYAALERGAPPRTPLFATNVDSDFPSPRFDAKCNAVFPTKGEYCQQYAPSPAVTTALIGDSHAEHYLHGVGARLVARGENVVHLGESGCPPLFGVERIVSSTPDTCEANASVLEFIGGNPALTRVVMAFRGTTAVTEKGFAPFERGSIHIGLRGSSASAADAVRQGLLQTVEYLRAHGKEVWLLLQVPELDFMVDECAGRPFSFERHVRTPCGVAKDRVLARQAPYRAIVDEVRQRVPALRVFDPLPYLCDDRFCFAVVDGRLLYMDNHHLSRAGSLFFADKFTF